MHTVCRQRDELIREAAHLQVKTQHVDSARQARVNSMLQQYKPLYAAIRPHSSVAPAAPAAFALMKPHLQHHDENDDASEDDEQHSIMTLDGELVQAGRQSSLRGAEVLAGNVSLEASVDVGQRRHMVEEAPSSPGCFFSSLILSSLFACCVMSMSCYCAYPLFPRGPRAAHSSCCTCADGPQHTSEWGWRE